MHPTLPLSEFSKFHSLSLDESRQNVADIFCPHRLSVNSKRSNLETRVHEADFGRSALVFITYGTAVTIDTDKLGHCYLVQVPWRGNAQIATEDGSVEIRPGVANVISPDQSMRMRWSGNCSFFSVRLDRYKVEQKLTQLIGHGLQLPLKFESIFDLDTANGRSWLNTVNYVKQQLLLARDMSAAEVMLEQLENILCSILLQSANHNYSADLQGPLTSLHPKTVKRACAYIRENIREKISMQQLVEVTGAVPSTLSRHFKHYLGQSPMNYVRREKLAAIHKILKKDGIGIRVTDIAMEFGFNHLGRFAEYYRRNYGELPSSTCRQLKEF